jgi:hypothetical protein
VAAHARELAALVRRREGDRVSTALETVQAILRPQGVTVRPIDGAAERGPAYEAGELPLTAEDLLALQGAQPEHVIRVAGLLLRFRGALTTVDESKRVRLEGHEG